MYRAANASYNDLSGSWFQPVGSQPSYAIAQNTDGSISYLYMPPMGAEHWTTWQGAGQPVTYYAVNYGLTSSDATGAANAPALQGAIDALLSAGGGTLLLPAGQYKINAPISINPPSSAGIVIAGVSGQTEIIQLASGSDIFDVTGMNSYEGVRFRNLHLSYAPPNLTSPFEMVAINAVGSNAVTCESVVFHNCTSAFQTDGHSEFCGLLNCWIYYDLKYSDGTPVGDQTMITLNGPEGFIDDCVIYQTPLSKGGPTGCTAITLSSETATRFISNTHITAFAVGINITYKVVGIYCSNVRIDAYQNAVTILASSSDDTLYNIYFSNCMFACALEEGAAEESGVVISTAGGDNANVAGIYFANCSACGFGNAGIEIDGGQNVVITGGQYSSNGQNATPDTYLGAGIAITGAAEVTVSGVDCSGVSEYWNANGAPKPPPAQLYGITISNTVGEISNVSIDGCSVIENATGGIVVAQESGSALGQVYISSCNASGYSSYTIAVAVGGSVSDVRVTNCAGYNDTGVAFTPGLPSGTFYNTNFGYYGPITFYVWGDSVDSITVGNLATGLAIDAFYLPCNVGAEIIHTVGPAPSFGVVGM